MKSMGSIALVSNSGIYLYIAIEHPQDHNHDGQLLLYII